ncbi:hypothetical protein GLOIN_2v1816400 [Rhizophagus irregularis DAOM 181602=DAOM 197198]|nr:hypothetical protein GLOIN_2v1816400 [Rhizophagus irregularis DAOM 181602=DAOM 197198]
MACFTGASLERRSSWSTGPALKLTQNKESKMSSTTSNIHLVCFVRGETGKDIFPVVIDNNSTVENLGVEIRKVRQDLSQKNFDLYVRKFKQPNHGLVNTVNTTEKKQGELMEPPNKFTYYFSVKDIKGLKKNPPYLQYDGEIVPIHVIVYLQEVLEKDPEDTGL